MKSFLKYTLATVVGLFVWSVLSFLVMVVIISAISASSDSTVSAKKHTVLLLKLDKPIVDRASDNPFENFNPMSFQSEGQMGLNQLLEALKKAKTDENIDGIYMDLSFIPAGIATVDEIRNALIDFKQSGKFLYAYSEYMGQKTYYLASAADKIYMNPVGTMELKGLSSRYMFFKGALEKLGIEPVIFRHGKFKSAIEPFMLDKMSEANKLQTQTFVQSIWDYMVKNIAESRKLTPEKVNEIAEKFAVRSPKDAVALNIIDSVKYKDEVIDELVKLTGAESPEKLEVMNMEAYFDVKTDKKQKKDKREKIAVIYASGEIGMGKGESQTIGSETISKAIRKARRDSTIKAIVLRVNSPGGSALASDIIWREAVLAQKAKPFIVSMGDVAASGGYYIACPADVIVASPVTITGSIGVFGLMFNTQKLMNQKLGITFDGIKTNQYADLPNLSRAMSEDEKAIIQHEVESIYDVFIGHVGEGRKMEKAAVDSIGQGRVWSGANAKEIGLVDEFGGLDRAIAIAAEKAGLAEYKTVDFPEVGDPFEEFVKQLTGETRTRIMQRELGETYVVYKQVDALLQMQGTQARMPFEVELY